ncbi:MAG: TrkH family potassium uptake protein [Bacteroidales bacterium]|nr:TrkH family potassium uptake protein [Bacteroidales bacterium]
MINKKMILNVMGSLLLIETAMLLLCSAISFFYKEDDLSSFLITAGITAVCGVLLYLYGKKGSKELNRKDGYIIVTLSWITVSTFGMLPFYISGYIPSITDAFFESISGFTSTGSSILDNIEEFPHGLLFWRSLTQWIGGLGIVFFTIAVLPFLGVSGVQLFAAEATGLTHDKVHPRIGITAKWIWLIYLGLTLTEVILLYIGDMSLFDSICHSLATTSTGGFSTKQSSIAFYNSQYIEYIITLFMFLSGINFSLYILLINRRFKKLREEEELKLYIASVLFFSAIVTISLYFTNNESLEYSIRTALFQIVSIHTSTGFATTDYMTWQPIAWGVLLIVMITGACAESTSGGIKCIRLLILGKITRNEFKRILHPNAVLPVRVNKTVIPNTIQSTVLAFLFLYFAFMFVSILVFQEFGLEFNEAVGIAISSISNTGPGLGRFSPSFSWSALPDVIKWWASFLMLLGRLELFSVLLIFTPGFWRKS